MALKIVQWVTAQGQETGSGAGDFLRMEWALQTYRDQWRPLGGTQRKEVRRIRGM